MRDGYRAAATLLGAPLDLMVGRRSELTAAFAEDLTFIHASYPKGL
jgi:hypothetical protein